MRAAGAGPLVTATDGKTTFKDAGCGSCHTLAAAASSGKIGPDFDQVKPSRSLIVKTLRASKLGTMVAYKGLLSNARVNAVAAYIARNEGQGK